MSSTYCTQAQSASSQCKISLKAATDLGLCVCISVSNASNSGASRRVEGTRSPRTLMPTPPFIVGGSPEVPRRSKSAQEQDGFETKFKKNQKNSHVIRASCRFTLTLSDDSARDGSAGRMATQQLRMKAATEAAIRGKDHADVAPSIPKLEAAANQSSEPVRLRPAESWLRHHQVAAFCTVERLRRNTRRQNRPY